MPVWPADPVCVCHVVLCVTACGVCAGRSQQAAGSPQEPERYIRLPERAGAGGGGRPRDAASFEQTHIYLTASPRHKDLLRLPGSRSARAHLEKSNSENALQRLGVRSPAGPSSSSSHHKSSREPSSGPLQRLLRLEQRSPRATKPRASSLERNHKFRVVPSPSRARSPESVRSRLESPPPLSTPQQGSPSPRLRLTPAKHELSPGLVNLVMSKDRGGGGVQGNFINKPARGWLHADGQVADEGICYAVRVSPRAELGAGCRVVVRYAGLEMKCRLLYAGQPASGIFVTGFVAHQSLGN